MSSQQRIEDFVSGSSSVFDDVGDYLGGLYGRLRSGLSELGLDLDWLSQMPGEANSDIGPDDELWVYQFVTVYSGGSLADGYPFSENTDHAGGVTAGSPSPEVQFKTGVYVLGEPEDAFERRLREVDNPRLRTLFNTGVYAGYMDGFGFTQKETYIQREEVSEREVAQKEYGLGTPWFEVEAYDEDGSLAGYADGYFNPFSTETQTERTVTGEEPPQSEVWKFGARQSHSSGDRYQISPPARTNARKRAKAAAGKTAYINGMAVGSILQRGRIRLKVEYANPERASYASRKQIIDQTGTPYQALSEGANLYKVKEDDNGVYFSTVEPQGFEAPDADAISPDAVGVEVTETVTTEIFVDEDDPTTFIVETDEQQGRLLGLYNPVVARDITEGSDFVRY